MQEQAKGKIQDINIPKAQRRPPAPPIVEIAKSHADRNAAIVAAHATGEYSYQEIVNFFDLHFTTIGKIVRAAKEKDPYQARFLDLISFGGSLLDYQTQLLQLVNNLTSSDSSKNEMQDIHIRE